ncbi:MAG: response regulator [Anaerolineae bacterium]|nr:response regulator [Anaerolineae bacterium]
MRKRHILVVEDHQLLLEAIEDLLKVAGYEVSTAANGNDALELMRRFTPDLILSDITMPKMDGYELYETVRENPEWIRIPFIFLTARGERRDVLKGKALGAEDYIVKPFDTEELLVAIDSRLGRAQAIQRASDQEFEHLKQQILNVLSHELRTPLTYISGYTDLALDDVESLTPDQLQEFLLGIKRGADRLTRLVKDMLLVVQIDTGRAAEEFSLFSTVRDDLGALVRQVVLTYQSRAKESGVTLGVILPEHMSPVRVHDEYFCNALGRLIDNAIKFSLKSPKSVTVQVRSNDKWVEVVVIDRGVGIANADLKSIFKRFQQFDRDTMEQQGAGLGLFIAQSLVNLHEGELDAVSQPGEGSTFTLRLPVARA